MNQRHIIAAAILVVAAGAGVLQWTRSSSVRSDILLLSGTVEVTEVSLGFKTSGRIAEMFVSEGQRIEKGQRLAVLDRAEIESVVAQGRATVRYAEATFEKARKDFERYEKLVKDDVISAQQMDAARANHDVARSQLQQAQAALRTAEVRLGDTVLLAPGAGTVIQRNTEPGETVSAGGTVFTIGQLDAPWVKVYVNETRMGSVKLGQRAEVRVDSFPNRTFAGTVTQISSDAEFTPKHIQTQEERVKLVFGVKVGVVNEDRALKPGMPADVTIFLAN